MNRMRWLAVVFLGAIGVAHAATRNVFFAGGQSNAKAVWGSAIASGLQAGYGSSLVMVWTNHSGEAMDRWYTTAPRVNYSNDLFNASGTGLLQAQIHAITNAGDQAVFKGVFWFQGEGDSGNYPAMDAYTNRFNGMLAQLKQDLGMTNDVRFTMAIIDANQDPALDDDLALIGRTHAMVDYLRTNQIDLSSGPQGSYVDTRSYSRGTDVWHLPTDELTRLGLDMSAAYTNTFGVSPPPSETVTIISHVADGAAYPTATFPDQTLICGVSGTTMFNGIAFFQLPANRIESADLTLTVEQNYGPITNANVDVWGLGYLSAPAMSSAWMLTADTDTRALLNFNVPFTKIADNIVTSGQATAVGTVWQLNASQRTNLTAFLNSLYSKGAVPGDYVAFRVNPDAPFSAARNVRFGSSAQVSPDRRPKLTVTLLDEPAPSATEGVFKVYSHANDGGVFATGTSTANDLISGTGGTGTQDYNGVAFFELPEQPMTSVMLSLPAVTFSGVMPSANIDVWGLGYTSSPALTTATAWFCTNDVDTRVLLNGYPPVKLADNIVTAGQTVAVGNVWQPSAKQAEDLRWFLNGLYNKGAKPGDYAVIRVNMDNRQQPVTCGVRWGGSQQTDTTKRASLSGVFPVTSNYLMNAGFEAGTGPAAVNWAVQYNNFLGQRTNVSVRSGESAFRFAVNGDQSTNTASNINVLQTVNNAGLAGQRVTFSGYARHDGSEPLVSNSVQLIEFRLWWLINGAPTGGYIDSVTKLLPSDPTNTYKWVSVMGVAPTNVSGVTAQVIFRTGTLANPAITNGAVVVDDLRLSVFEPAYPPAPAGTQILLR